MRNVSLGGELAILILALEGVGDLLGDEVPTIEEKTSRRARAVLAVVAERLRLVRRVVTGTAEVDQLAARFNELDGADPADDPDVTLSSKRAGSRRTGPPRTR